VTEYRTAEDGTKIKHVRKIKVTKVKQKVNRNVVARRAWKKFGDCASIKPGVEDNITYISGEAIRVDFRAKKQGEGKEEPEIKIGREDGSIVVCRNCGKSGHWTLRCPERRKIGMSNEELAMQPDASSDAPETPTPSSARGEGGKYVPPNMRPGAADRSSAKPRFDRDDANTLKVTNLSEDTTEDDIRELFRNFGHTTRVYLARDRLSGESRGFAFVTYQTRQDAERAVHGLNGHGYDNLILHVEFAKPREEKKEGGPGNATGGK